MIEIFAQCHNLFIAYNAHSCVTLGWMKATAVSHEEDHDPRGKGSSKKRKSKPVLDSEIYVPAYALRDMLELRKNKVAYTMFVKTFLKPVYSLKWKAKQYQEDNQGVADMVTVSDEAFVLLALENNYERWLDINNKSKNCYSTLKQGRSTFIDSDVMPKYTWINKKRTDIAGNEEPKANWRGWNDEGIMRFNELCKLIKEDRKKNAKVDKGIFAELEPDDRKQPSRRKRRKKVGAPVKAFVDSDGDDSDSDSAHSDSDEEE